MSSLNDLIQVIRSKNLMDFDTNDDREALSTIFMKALKKSYLEIQQGADNDDFSDLTVINTIIMGDKAGYSSDEIKVFIEQLKSDDEYF